MNDYDDNSLTAQLVVQRLAMPGVLDHTPVQRKYERLQQGTVRHELAEQLHQRATASGEAGGSSLVWRRSPERVDSNAEGLPVSAGTTSVAAAGSTPISRATSPIVQRSALPGAESTAVTDRLTSRAHSPGVLAVGSTGSTISRPAATSSFSNAPAFAAQLQSRHGVTSSESAAAAAPVQAAPAPPISRAPAGVIRRQVDAANSTASPSSHDTASVVPALSPVSRGMGAASASAEATADKPMLARKAFPASAVGGTVRQADMPQAGNGSPAAPDLRMAVSPQVPGIPMIPAARPLLSAGSAAGEPLVLRRKLAAPAQSSTPFPTFMPPAGVELPREETPAPLQSKPNPYVAMKAGAQTGSDIDRIADEVARRLMRRLEIERERKGIRQWR
jgi:hypothetical protein